MAGEEWNLRWCLNFCFSARPPCSLCLCGESLLPICSLSRSAKPLREPAFTVTAADLHSEYEANYQAGMRKFLGQYVNVTGRVQTRFFPRSLELDDQIGLDGKDGYPWVYCSFDEDQVETAEALELGQMDQSFIRGGRIPLQARSSTSCFSEEPTAESEESLVNDPNE